MNINCTRYGVMCGFAIKLRDMTTLLHFIHKSCNALPWLQIESSYESLQVEASNINISFIYLKT